MIPLALNQAVSDPRKALSRPQQNALQAIIFFRHQELRNGKWQIGNKRIEVRTVSALKDMALIRQTRDGLEPTLAGRMASDKLKGPTDGAR